MGGVSILGLCLWISKKGDRAMDRNMVYAGTAIVLAALLGFSWGKGGGGLNADDSKPATNDIAVVDLAKVFAAHKGLQAKNEELKQEYERVNEELKALTEAAQKIQGEFNAAKKGSAESQRLEGEFKKKVDAFKKLQEDSQKKFGEANAVNLMAVYQLVNEEVARIAEARGFRLVMNFTSESLDQKDPQKRQLIFTRQVLYQNGLDITDDVITAFN
jgi:Skp family chaperone for outer membrane proteins